MLTLAKFPSKSVSCITHSQKFHIPTKTHFSFPPKHLNFHSFGKNRTGFCLRATKPKKTGDFSGSKIDGPDEFENVFENDDDEYDEEDDDGVPSEEMEKWFKNRPSGFGEGKAYDTSIEDKLMEEIEQSRKAQLVNLNKLKNNPVPPKKQNQQVSTHVQEGVRVRVVNLPKKKNVHRDLRLAFQGVRGILNIIPAVIGNKKTRDPVCKGIAFIYFRSEDDAQRFVQNFSGQSISFGKVQKQIKCNMMNFNSTNLVSEQREEMRLDETSDSDIDTDDELIASSQESLSSEYDVVDERYIAAQFEDVGDNLESSRTQENETTSQSSLKKGNKKGASGRKKGKKPKLNSLGAAKRLKTREKEVLTEVFSKYGTNPTMAVKEES